MPDPKDAGPVVHYCGFIGGTIEDYVVDVVPEVVMKNGTTPSVIHRIKVKSPEINDGTTDRQDITQFATNPDEMTAIEAADLGVAIARAHLADAEAWVAAQEARRV